MGALPPAPPYRAITSREHVRDADRHIRRRQRRDEVIAREATELGVRAGAGVEPQHEHVARLRIDDPVLGDAGSGVLGALLDPVALDAAPVR